jgi:hypothetical protein
VYELCNTLKYKKHRKIPIKVSIWLTVVWNQELNKYGDEQVAAIEGSKTGGVFRSLQRNWVYIYVLRSKKK